jgi:hypothetical protein
MKQSFTIDLAAFKSSGAYCSEYCIGGMFSVIEDNQFPVLDEVIEAVKRARNSGSIPKDFDYLIETGIPFFVKANL